MQYFSIYMYTVGEFGIVYKGYIVKEQGSIVTDTVAIKTLKGIYPHVLISSHLTESHNNCIVKTRQLDHNFSYY